jgi:hypothetical protein
VNNLLYIADTSNHVIRVVNLTTNIITRFAGIAKSDGSSGDGKTKNLLVDQK